MLAPEPGAAAIATATSDGGVIDGAAPDGGRAGPLGRRYARSASPFGRVTEGYPQWLPGISGANSALQANKDRLARSLFALGAESSRCTKCSG
jgi:hypothetical protein